VPSDALCGLAKTEQLAAAQKQRPLAAYRAAELAIMSRNFSGPSESYPELRRAFVYKHKPTRTPPHLTRQPALPRHSDPRPPDAQEAPAILGHQPGPTQDQATFLDCPACLGPGGAERCGLPAEVEQRYSIESTDGALESARIRCPQGHWFNGPVESLTIPQPPARAGTPGSPPSHLTIQDRGAHVTGPMHETQSHGTAGLGQFSAGRRSCLHPPGSAVGLSPPGIATRPQAGQR
jgi:hypothetical protein